MLRETEILMLTLLPRKQIRLIIQQFIPPLSHPHSHLIVKLCTTGMYYSKGPNWSQCNLTVDCVYVWTVAIKSKLNGFHNIKTKLFDGDFLYNDLLLTRIATYLVQCWFWYISSDILSVSVDLDLCSLSGKTTYRQISWSLEAARLDVNDRIALKFDRHLGSDAVEVAVKFQSDWKSLNQNLAASRLHEILR